MAKADNLAVTVTTLNNQINYIYNLVAVIAPNCSQTSAEAV